MKENKETKLYFALSQFVFDWVKEQNDKGKKPFQSEIIGALEMVKTDIYTIQSSKRILAEQFRNIFEKFEGKSITISKENIVIK